VWLTLAWALWLAAAAPVRPALRALRRRLPAGHPAWLSRARLAAVAIASLASIAGVAVVGDAVAATARPDSHIYDYRPIRQVAAAIERLVPPGVNVDFGLGPLDRTTQPMEPAIRFLLVRHGDRPMAEGSFPRLGSFYQLLDRPVQWKVYLTDSARRRRHMTLAARVRFAGPWGRVELSAWVEPVPHR
jgi:hypothetical protein